MKRHYQTETEGSCDVRAGHPLDRIRTAADRLLITDWPTPFLPNANIPTDSSFA